MHLGPHNRTSLRNIRIVAFNNFHHRNEERSYTLLHDAERVFERLRKADMIPLVSSATIYCDIYVDEEYDETIIYDSFTRAYKHGDLSTACDIFHHPV